MSKGPLRVLRGCPDALEPGVPVWHLRHPTILRTDGQGDTGVHRSP